MLGEKWTVEQKALNTCTWRIHLANENPQIWCLRSLEDKEDNKGAQRQGNSPEQQQVNATKSAKQQYLGDTKHQTKVQRISQKRKTSHREQEMGIVLNDELLTTIVSYLLFSVGGSRLSFVATKVGGVGGVSCRKRKTAATLESAKTLSSMVLYRKLAALQDIFSASCNSLFQAPSTSDPRAACTSHLRKLSVRQLHSLGHVGCPLYCCHNAL